MTTGTFKFQIVQDRNQPIDLTGLGHTQQIKISQEQSVVFLDKSMIDEMIKTLRACKKWLNSP
jgi:hypothetical protein